MKGNQAQITFTLPLELLEKVNKAADQLSLSRAGFMKMAISRAVESEGV
jgi:predicted DNA-binding protein